jgi:hypothetical protein
MRITQIVGLLKWPGVLSLRLVSAAVIALLVGSCGGDHTAFDVGFIIGPSRSVTSIQLVLQRWGVGFLGRPFKNRSKRRNRWVWVFLVLTASYRRT